AARRLERFHLLVFVVRRDTGLEVSNAELARDGFGGARVVAREHENINPEFAQFRERQRRGGLHGVSNGQDASGAAINGYENGSCTFGLEWSGQCFESGEVRHAAFTKESRFANQHGAPSDSAGHTGRRGGLKILRGFELNLAFASGHNDSVRQRMLAALFERG